MELNIESLRKERRPLWMTGLGEESEDLEEARILMEGRYVAEDYIS